jgi:hypothetical protein
MAYDNQYFAPMGLLDFYTDNFYQYLVPLGPRIPNKILQPITGYYFLGSPEFVENQKVLGPLCKMGSSESGAGDQGSPKLASRQSHSARRPFIFF